MDDIAIRVEHLGKQYRIGGKQERFPTLRDKLVDTCTAPFRRLSSIARGQLSTPTNETIWALKDVSFEVKRGEVVGIIGRNGAGKTTLLKILSRITEPTEGYAEIHGRVGSLLEVGTGFHPELTGRENIYLNAAILGMKKAEIERRFDEIVAFAEIEKFMDTPVKRYSSGMYVRLAFAVAAHLEPEILLVDEVLAVGDASFQKKCLGKMGDVAKEGRTVLFVSHNMIAVRNLCRRAVWLQEGVVLQDGDALTVTEAYLGQSLRAESIADIGTCISLLPPDPLFKLEAVEIRQNGQPCDVVRNGKPTEVEIRYTILKCVSGLRVYFDLLDRGGDILIRSFHDEDADGEMTMEPGRYISLATIPANLLTPAEHTLRVAASVDSAIDDYHTCIPGGLSIPLSVEWTSEVNRSRPRARIISKIQPKIPWRTFPNKS